MNQNRFLEIVGGVTLFLIVLIAFFFLIEHIFFNSKEESSIKQKTEQVSPSYKRSIERRFKKNDEDHKIFKEQLKDQNERISNLESKDDGSSELDETKSIQNEEKPKKENVENQKKKKRPSDFRDSWE